MPATPEELLVSLAATPDHTYPLKILTEIRARLPEMTPALLDVLEKARQCPADYADLWILPMFSVYFLAEAREKAAYRPLIALLDLSEADVEILFGDLITEDMCRILASVFDGDQQPLRDLVENPNAPEFVRSCVLKTYLCLLHHGHVSHEIVSGYFTELMRGRLSDTNEVVWSNLASYSADLGLAHLIPDIQKAYREGWTDSLFDHEADVVGRARNGGDPNWQRHAGMITDSIAMTRHWHCFQPQSPPRNSPIPQFSAPTPSATMRSTPKIGRNDPCPCNSGKKYKKCCGA
jgi:Protein of unknown function (DUF1186)/SEC-C motif